MIFVLEAMVGALSYVYQGKVEDELAATLNTTFIESYQIDKYKTEAIDKMQQEVSNLLKNIGFGGAP